MRPLYNEVPLYSEDYKFTTVFTIRYLITIMQLIYIKCTGLKNVQFPMNEINEHALSDLLVISIF